jgi:hypothetical protein
MTRRRSYDEVIARLIKLKTISTLQTCRTEHALSACIRAPLSCNRLARDIPRAEILSQGTACAIPVWFRYDAKSFFPVK